jgi:hypothetical protein
MAPLGRGGQGPSRHTAHGNVKVLPHRAALARSANSDGGRCTGGKIVAYEPPTHLAYTIVRGQPVRNYRAEVTLTLDRDGTLISWTGTFDPLIPGTGMLLTAFFGRIITRFANGLANYAGT